VIVDRDQVSLTAEGVTRLVGLLNSNEDNVVILAGTSDTLQEFIAINFIRDQVLQIF